MIPDTDELQTRLRGPVYPILTPFTETGALDLAAHARYIDWLVERGAGVILETVGTSRFNLLREEEMQWLNRSMVDTVNDRAFSITTGPPQASTNVNIEFAAASKEMGANAHMIVYPERHYGDAAIYEFFETVTRESGQACMIHEMPMRSGLGGGSIQYSLELLERLCELPGLVGMKEECMDAGYSYKLHRRFSERTRIIGAGSMRNFLRDHHAGADTYLVGIENVRPDLGARFYDAVMSNDYTTAHEIVRTHEDPVFDVAVRWGWHPSLKEMLDICGLMPAHERAPFTRIPAEGREELESIVRGLGWREGLQ